MKKPIILITTSNANAEQLAEVTGDTEIIYSDRAAALAVIRAGGLPVYVPAVTALEETDLEEYLDQADGVLITGADSQTNPEYYGETATHLKGRIDDERDRTDLELIKLAYEKKLPMLGVCKGMQLINVAFGGTLYQNIADQAESKLDHDVRNSRTKVTHEATVAEDSMLNDIFQSTKIGLNGGHQQGVRKLAPQLKPVATTSDGLVEAFEGSDDQFLLGIQFHAELIDEPAHRAIFETFVDACRR